MAADRQHDWSLIIGDDTSARLPVRFVRKVFEARGKKIDTRFIATSSATRATKDEGVFDERAAQMVAGRDDVRALIVTESAGTYRGLSFFA